MTVVFGPVIAVLPTRCTRTDRAIQTTVHRQSRAANSFRLAGRAAKGRARHLHLATHCLSDQRQYAQQGNPNISLLDPVLQQQWDHAANAHLGNLIIKPYSHKEVWWTCDQCPDGHPHRWFAFVYSRTKGNGCPQCRGQAVCKHNSLATKAPKVAAQWDHEVNDGTPDSVLAQSSHKVGWHCDACGHKWKASPNGRVCKLQSGCPACAKSAKIGKKKLSHPSFEDCQHVLLQEWDYKRNAAQGNYPNGTRLRSNKKIFWVCSQCPAGQQHSWSAAPYHRTGRSQSGCPFCAGKTACRCNSLQALYPDIAAEWDHSKNEGHPSDFPGSSTHVAWWSSPQRASWQQAIYSRTSPVQERSARPRRLQQRQERTSMKPEVTEA